MATAGFPVGGGYQSSHRGHGFAFGHPQFQMPSQVAPTRNATLMRARSVGNNHGSAELGRSPGTARNREREREPRRRDGDRSPSASASASSMIGDPIAQASAYRQMPAGPQEAESMQTAYENLINRLMTVESSLRQHAQLIGAQSETIAKQAELIETNTTRCKWLHDHLNNTVNDIKHTTDDQNN